MHKREELDMYGAIESAPAIVPAPEQSRNVFSPERRAALGAVLALAGMVAVISAMQPQQASPRAERLEALSPPAAQEQQEHVTVAASRVDAATATNSPWLKMTIESREYGVLNSSYPFLEHALFAEPQREYEMKVDASSALQSCEWSAFLVKGGGVYDDITGVDPASGFHPTGNLTAEVGQTMTIEVVFPSPGTYGANLTCSFEAGGWTSAYEEVEVFYIRRELRALSSKDMNQFLSAFVTMYRTPTAHGRTIYGKHYRSLTDFQVMHLRAAGGIVVDHMHDGLGVATQHAAMTMEFELSMQSVNPRLSVPYWDYTYDSEQANANGKETPSIFRDSWLFSDEVFGRTSEADHAVLSGRMSQIKLAVDFNYTTRSAYGYLRAPWNLNPSENVTRFHKMCGEAPYVHGLYSAASGSDESLMWPTCEMHWNTVHKTEYDVWFDWAWKISYAPHGPVHAWIGGVGGACDGWDTLVDEGLLTTRQLQYAKHWAFAMLKNAYRAKTITMPSVCSLDAQDACMWKCADRTEDNAALFVEALGLIPNVTSETTGFWKIAETILCDSKYFPGDQLEASSPVEASFWPIHPTIDRLLQYKDITKPFTNKTWEGMGDVCLSTSSDCKGHHAYDLTFYKSITQDKATGEYEISHKTNLEIRNAVMPRSGDYAVTYIYDNFRWDHCTSVGWEF